MAKSSIVLLTGIILFVLIFGLYLGTAAAGLVPGDPAEYTLVAHLLGIAHPPGYAFMTLLTKLWQTLVPLGAIAQRSHWLAGAAGALTAALVFGAVHHIRQASSDPSSPAPLALLPSLLAALSVALAADHWQHSIHLNSHIITATLNALAVFLLVRWWQSIDSPQSQRWLYAFCVVAGLGPTHHPLTVFSFPAYTVFIILVRPELVSFWRRDWWLRQPGWRSLLTMVFFGLLGLAVWIYYPLRSPMRPEFGPADMNTLDGFLNVALARGLRVNLFHFGLAQQGQRLLVFWTLLRQQFALPVIALAAGGLVWLFKRHWRVAVFLSLILLGNLAFVINSVQDVMAYLLTPFMLIGLLAGVGAIALISLIKDFTAKDAESAKGKEEKTLRPLRFILWIGLLIWPVMNLAQNLPRISLRYYEAGDEYVAAVAERFVGSGEGATLLNDWEHQTLLWYDQFVDGRQFDPADVSASLVSTDRPWLQRVFDHLPGGPVYLNGYRREIVDAGFRLRPEGIFYQVVEPGDTSMPAAFQTLPAIPNQPIELLGYWLVNTAYPAGGLLSLDLAMRAPVTPTDYLVPYVQLGDLDFIFTTDSHLLTPWWRPGEVIVERFSFALPHDLVPGAWPLQLGLVNLGTGNRSELAAVTELEISANPTAPSAAVLDKLIANFGQRVGVDRVTVRGNKQRRTALWDEPLPVRPGDDLDVTIQWRCLAPIEESYTVFVHLMDAGNQVWAQQDYTPLGGSYPTYLWIPKWLPGQTALDPYRLTVPPNTPPGDYYIEIGLYGMTTRQRVYQYDRVGNLVGDRLVLGLIRVR